MQTNPLTLHIRLTRACNADCGYCSSWQETPDDRLQPEALAQILDFVLDTARDALGVSPTHVTAQFLGGEIALVPEAELTEHVRVVREACARRRLTCVVGGQSNLIVSERKAAALYDMFEGRLGTSVDSTSNARTIKGDAEKYRLLWKSADTYLKRNRSTPGAIYVVEPDSLDDAVTHLSEAARAGRAITFRPIFTGGIKSVQVNSADQFRSCMEELFDRWFMRLPVIAEPFFQLCEARLAESSGLGRVISTSCAFQSDCTTKSINIDPNGDLHVCLEMADAGLPAIGNGLRKEWHRQPLSVFSSRNDNLPSDCLSCPYLRSCRGGCMYESIAQGNGTHGKSFHCASWKSLFARIDSAIEERGAVQVHEWLHRVATRHANSREAGLARAAFHETAGVE